MDRKWVATDFGGTVFFKEVDADISAPKTGEVTIEIKAAGMNPADFKHSVPQGDASRLPIPIGYEAAGVIRAMGPDTEIASGGGAVGDEVIAFRVSGGYATALTVDASTVFAKPAELSFPEAANLFLAGTTAADALHVINAAKGETILVHGASGAVGVSVLQQARELGITVIGTASEKNFGVVEQFGGIPVAYGDGLEDRVRVLAPNGIDAAIDTVGTDEAADVSLAVVADPNRIVTIANAKRAHEDGFQAIGGQNPVSAAYRDSIRAHLIQLAADGKLLVPVAKTYPLADAQEALELLKTGHPGGKLALTNE
jgi:NADPH2:quinone reductase